jgi:acetaldehyde dehydrogenase/alcohol dehydrogenase
MDYSSGEGARASGKVQELDALDSVVESVRAAQALYASFDQARVDAIFRAAAIAANRERIPLAKMAVEETGMGQLEDKVIKNHFASEIIYNKYKDLPTCGLIERDPSAGIRRIAEPLGVIAGVIPTTNPTSTAIFKTLIALKTRNGIVLSPHPRARKSTVAAARVVLEAAVAAGAPEGIIGWIAEPTIEDAERLMKHPSIALILATGGPGMVKAAYSSGKPALGVGAGNTPALIDESADIELAVSSVILSKTFDNGVICASEQSVVVVDSVYEAVKAEFLKRGAFFVEGENRGKLAAVLVKEGRVSPAIVGQSAATIARMAGFEAPSATPSGAPKLLVVETELVGREEPFSWEKLSPVLAMYRVADFAEGVERAASLVEFAGLGHTSVLYTDPANADRIDAYSSRMRTGRVLVNCPSAQGAIGDLYNFRLEPSLTLGCGSWGGNSVSENVGPRQLLNIKTVAERRENMLWFRLPPKVYLKRGCLATALREYSGKKRAAVVTDKGLYELGYGAKVGALLEEMGLAVEIIHDVNPDPSLANARAGAERMLAFRPDLIVAIGGGSAMDAAKIMWVLYEHPEADFRELSMRFFDIRKRIAGFPALRAKANLVCVPTTSGTGSETTPFAVITDESTGEKYPLADYELTPDMAIVDADLAMGQPRGLTASSGYDVLTHAVEALASVLATPYSDAMALESARMVCEYLPRAYRDGTDREAREKMHEAAAMAGMAFGNAFLGLCHSMAHKLGAAYHIPHGTANALLLDRVVRYNAAEAPTRQAAFSQYDHPEAAARYARLADYLGLGGRTPEAKLERLLEKFVALRAEVGLPATIGEAGVDEAAFMSGLDELSLRAFDDQCTGANPRLPLVGEIAELYRAAYYGK